MTLTTIALCASILAVAGWAIIFGGRAPGLYQQRSCRGRDWRERFPDAPKREIRKFLSVFVDSFAFREHEKLKFAPDDELMHIYRTLYPSAALPDALELETLERSLKNHYGVALADVWRENLTLGQLFQVTRRR